jgi:hypothetical protein
LDLFESTSSLGKSKNKLSIVLEPFKDEVENDYNTIINACNQHSYIDKLSSYNKVGKKFTVSRVLSTKDKKHMEYILFFILCIHNSQEIKQEYK